MPGDPFDSMPAEQLQQLRDAADAILDLRESFLELLMASDIDFERSVSAETQRCIASAMQRCAR